MTSAPPPSDPRGARPGESRTSDRPVGPASAREGSPVPPSSPVPPLSPVPSSSPIPPIPPVPVRVLVVDDELSIRRLLDTVLTNQGWEVRTAATGVEAVQQARSFQPHLMVLDVVLPDVDGIRVLKALRVEQSDAMVLFLSANSQAVDRIRGIEAGGDDYVTKPFSVREVVARLTALLRRSARYTAEAHLLPAPDLVVGDLHLNPDSHLVSRAGAPIELTATEFDLLRHLMENAGRVLAREDLLRTVWGEGGGRSSNILELYISYLRRKVDAGRPPLIRTIRRVGYVIRPSDEGGAGSAGAPGAGSGGPPEPRGPSAAGGPADAGPPSSGGIAAPPRIPLDGRP